MHIDCGHHTDLDYHRRMLDDLWRVEAFDRAIRALIQPGDVVLDLGCGTGLLAMLAARRGARVHAVESASVGAVAERLIAANGLADRITVHREDAVTLDVVEPVDWVVGEFLGRFVVDDEMLDAVAAAGRWLKPQGRFCPSEIRMQLAPAGDFPLPMVDRWSSPLLGLDLSAAAHDALNTCYVTQLSPGFLMAPAQDYAVLRPPARPERFKATVHYEVQRDGRFRGLLGFWQAQLAPGVQLTTAPGLQTHWGQYLFPAPPQAVRQGDRLSFSLHLEEGDDLVWVWQGSLEGSCNTQWSGRSHAGEPVTATSAPAWKADRSEVVDKSNQGSVAFQAGDMAEAVRHWAEATHALGPDTDDLAATVYENLGIGRLNAGQPLLAAEAFARALEGQTERTQSLQLLVTALARAGRSLDVVVWRDVFETLHGPHPDR